MAELTYTVEDAAAAIGIGKNSVYDLIAAGTMPHIRFGRTIRVPKRALQDWLDEKATQHAELSGDES